MLARPDTELRVFFGSDVKGAKHGSAGRLDDTRVYRQLRTVAFRLRLRGELVGLPWCPTLPLELQRFDPDIVILEGPSNVANNMLSLLWLRVRRRPHIWWSLGDLPGRERHGLKRALRRIADTGERSAATIISYSSQGADHFRSRGIPTDRIVTAVNTIDERRELADAAGLADVADGLRKELAPSGAPIVLFVGALTHAKRVDLLIDACYVLHGQGLRFSVVIVGDGAERATLERRAEDLPNVSFAGRQVEKAAAYFSVADIFVMPGLGGLAVSQALVHGLPIISAPADGSEADLVDHGRSGFLTDGTVPELARAMEALITSAEARQSFSAHATAHRIDAKLTFKDYESELRRAMERAVEIGA